jgi:hypothetical protein
MENIWHILPPNLNHKDDLWGVYLTNIFFTKCVFSLILFIFGLKVTRKHIVCFLFTWQVLKLNV